MFTRAKKILASELMYALDMDEDEAEEHLDDLLAESAEREHRRGLTRRSRADGGRARRGRRPRRTPWGRRAQGVRRAGRAVRCSSGASTRCARVPAIERIVVALPAGRRRARRGRPASPAGRQRSHSVARRARAPPARRRSWSSTTPRARCVTPRAGRGAARGALRRRLRRGDRRGAGDRHGQGGRRRRRASCARWTARALWAVQTPQVFRRDGARARARRRRRRRSPRPTDDASLVEAAGRRRARRRGAARRTSRSRRRATSASPSCCCASASGVEPPC